MKGDAGEVVPLVELDVGAPDVEALSGDVADRAVVVGPALSPTTCTGKEVTVSVWVSVVSGAESTQVALLVFPSLQLSRMLAPNQATSDGPTT